MSSKGKADRDKTLPTRAPTDFATFPLAARKPVPLYRLQTHSPGLPDLFPGEWTPGTAVAQLLKLPHSGDTVQKDGKGL